MVRIRSVLLIFLCVIPGLAGQPRAVLDVTNFIIVGGGWSAGYSDFQLLTENQEDSFPVQMAEQMGTIMPQPLFRPLGAPAVVSIDPLPQTLAPSAQSVLRNLPFPLFVFNLSVPLIKVSESLNSRPRLPIIQEGDFKQSMVNLVLGYPGLILDNPPIWSQVEYAAWMSPTVLIIQLGYGDILQGLFERNPGSSTSTSSFGNDYAELVDLLAGTHAQIILVDVPDPTDTAYLSTIVEVAQDYGVDPSALTNIFGLQSGDMITIGGLVEIGDYFEGRRGNQLSDSSVIVAQVADQISQTVEGYNASIRNSVPSGAQVYSLNSLVRSVRESGIQVGPYRIGGRYLEGFFSSDGLFPSPTGQALIANELLSLLNSSYGTSFDQVNVEEIADRDNNVTKEQMDGLKKGRGRYRQSIPIDRAIRIMSGEGRGVR